MCPHAQVPDHKAIRYVVSHEVTLLRRGLRRLLEDEPDLEIVAEAENAAQALRHILEQRPNVVIADPTLFGCAPPEAEQLILRESPDTRVVFLPSANPDESGPGALHQSKCTMRETSAEEFVAMVRGSAAAGGAVGCGAAVDASSPARNPASRTRWVALAVPTTRLRSSISSSAKGAVFGIGDTFISGDRSGRRHIARLRRMIFFK